LTLKGSAGTLAALFRGCDQIARPGQTRLGLNNETHLPTKQSSSQKNPWLSGPHGEQERPSNSEPAPAQGPGAALSVKPEKESCRAAGFPRGHRLRQASEFRAVFQDATRASDQNFTLLGRRNSEDHARLGLAISVKSAGKAVCRNRVKRAARESFRLLGGEIGNVDVVVMARRGIDNKTSAQMRASLDKLFRSISRKCEES